MNPLENSKTAVDRLRIQSDPIASCRGTLQAQVRISKVRHLENDELRKGIAAIDVVNILTGAAELTAVSNGADNGRCLITRINRKRGGVDDVRVAKGLEDESEGVPVRVLGDQVSGGVVEGEGQGVFAVG